MMPQFLDGFAEPAPSGCWLWRLPLDRCGYGYKYFRVAGKLKKLLAHRWVYREMVSEIPQGLEIDHLCRVRHCVNPAHLEAVTGHMNRARAVPYGYYSSLQTHCLKGHEYTEANTYRRLGSRNRTCRACQRAAVARYATRRKASAPTEKDSDHE